MDIEKMKYFAAYIENHLGIVYSDANYFQLENRLNEISGILGLAGIDELWRQCNIGLPATHKQLLLDIATNNETSFFRDPPVFRAFERHALPELAAQPQRPGKPIQVWSAASSTGQEPYSLAILIAELRAKAALPPIRIVATDVSERVLKRAAAGAYSQIEVQRGLPASLLIRYFSKRERLTPEDQLYEWEIKPEIKAMVSFQSLNLLSNWGPWGPFDAVFCRNILIYQSVENKKKILSRLSSSIAPGGYLVMGAAESLMGLSEDFDMVSLDGAVFYRRKAQAAP